MANRLSSIAYRRKGSALLIAMIVITAISAAAFGLAKLLLSDIRITSSLEDSTAAYYAAEAGIEHGLLKFRIDRTTEVPVSAPVTVTLAGGRSYTMTSVYRQVNPPATTTGCGQAAPNYIPENCSLEFSTSLMNGNLRVSWVWRSAPSDINRGGLEWTRVLDDGTICATCRELMAPSSTSATISTGNTSAIRVKPVGGTLTSVSVSSSQGGESVDSRISTIESVGTVGLAKRKLQALVDRDSGTIIGLFDFVVSSGEDVSAP
jgi:Tfp pilus assembly protein PilX